MGFYIRKSVKFGPIRFNISKSGIGISSGIPGARISTGPRGTYINMGKNEFITERKLTALFLSDQPRKKVALGKPRVLMVNYPLLTSLNWLNRLTKS